MFRLRAVGTLPTNQDINDWNGISQHQPSVRGGLEELNVRVGLEELQRCVERLATELREARLAQLVSVGEVRTNGEAGHQNELHDQGIRCALFLSC